MSGPRKPRRSQDKQCLHPPASPLNNEDQAAFQAAMAGVAALPAPNQVFHPAAPVSPWPRKNRENTDNTTAQLHDTLSDHEPDDYTGAEDLSYLRAGMPSQTLRKLRRGHWAVQAQLDLHGMNSDDARRSVSQFIAECRQFDIRCVRIVHGKGFGSVNGEPVLKRKLRNWLIQKEDVLAFCQARPADGGSGAAIVLLKAA